MLELVEGPTLAERVTITEALPAPEESWLRDDEGRRYTCEFRIVVVDEVPYA